MDEQLRHKMASGMPQAQRLLGKCAVANARLAYRRFLESSSAERWRSLEAAGARPQRLLWASTSTKNPAYDELMYVEPLIGPHTVTTLPRKTSAAFAAHVKAAATLEQGHEEAAEVVKSLATAGVDLAQVTGELLDEGIEKFIAAFDDVVQTIAAKAGRAAGARQEQSLGGH